MKKIVYSAMKTPDGTLLESLYRHDYVTHTDKNGKEYMLDGGNDYCRSSMNGDEEFIVIYEDDHHEIVRNHAVRQYQTIGPVRIKDMSDNWLKGSIEWIRDKIYGGYTSLNGPHYRILMAEVEYRHDNNITVNETYSYKTGSWVPETYPSKKEVNKTDRKARSKEVSLSTDERAIQALVEYAEENMLRDRSHLVWRTIEFIFSSHLGKGEVSSVHT